MPLFSKTLTDPFIAPAEPDDIPQIASIHAQSFSRAWSKNELGKLLSADGTMCLVLRREGKIQEPPMGFVLCRQVAGEAEIISLATEQKYRHRGVAKHLMEAAIRNLQSDRVDSLFLEVSETNRPACTLYRKLGFRQAGSRKGYYTGISGDDDTPATRGSDALVMHLDLR